MSLKIEALEETKKFYLWELKKEDLTERERSNYLLALKSIEKVIREKEDLRERRKHKILNHRKQKLYSYLKDSIEKRLLKISR